MKNTVTISPEPTPEPTYGPNSYFWDGKMDGLNGYEPEDDNLSDPEYVAGYETGKAMFDAKPKRS